MIRPISIYGSGLSGDDRITLDEVLAAGATSGHGGGYLPWSLPGPSRSHGVLLPEGILTTAHGVAGGPTAEVECGGHGLEVRVERFCRSLDLALLVGRRDGDLIPLIETHRVAILDETPLGPAIGDALDVLDPSWRRRPVTVLEWGLGYWFVVTRPDDAGPGWSGCPVLTLAGQLVGIHVSHVQAGSLIAGPRAIREWLRNAGGSPDQES